MMTCLLERRSTIFTDDSFRYQSGQILFRCARLHVDVKTSVYKSYDDLPLFLNASLVAQVLGVSSSSGYELMHTPGFPVLRVGSRMVVPFLYRLLCDFKWPCTIPVPALRPCLTRI